MKHNTMKRVLAATLSVLTVASPMTANVGGILQEVAIVANAAAVESERVALNWAGTVYDTAKGSTYLTSFKINGTTQTGLTANDNQKVESGSRVELTSTVPLAFKFGAGVSELKTLTLANSEQYGANGSDYSYDLTENMFLAHTKVQKTIGENPQFERVVDTSKPKYTPDAMADVLLAEAGFDVDTDETFTKFSAWNIADVEQIAETDYTTLTVNFYAKETVNGSNYTYNFVMPADNESATADDTLSVSSIDEDYKLNFYESEAERNKATAEDAHTWVGAFNDQGETFKDGVTVSCSDTNTNENNATRPRTFDVNSMAYTGTSIRGDVVTVTAAIPFVIHVNDNDDTVNWINPETTYDSEKKVFKTTFTMPKSKDSNKEVQVDVVKNDEQYTYTVKDSKLLATTKSGSIKNAEAAGITAKYYNSAADAATFGTANDKGTVVNGAIPNGKFVAIGVSANDKLATETVNPVKIKKGSAVLSTTEAAPNDELDILKNAANDEIGYLISEKAGTYDVTYTVKGKDSKDYEVTYSFTIAAKSALTAENVTLKLEAKKDNAPIDLNGIMAADQNLLNLSGKTGQTATYMIASGKAKEVEKAGYQFTVTPTVYTDAANKVDANKLPDTSYYVEGNPSGSKLGYTYTFTIYITDPEYGGSEKNPKTITMTWEVVDYDEVPQWKDNLKGVDKSVENGGSGNTKRDATGSIEDIDALEDAIFKAADPNDAAVAARKAGEVRYQWIEGSGAVRTNEKQDELDEWNDGLPTEMGEYTVYIIYKDVVKATVYVNISKYALNIFADESDLTYTYGKKFELKKPTTQKNAAGKTVDVNVSELKCTIYQVATNDDGEPLMNAYDKDGEPVEPVAWDGKSSDFTRAVRVGDAEPIAIANSIAIEEVGQLPAGYYAITFTGTAADDNYSVSGNTAQLLTVNKKKITDKSIVILVDPFTYDGQQHDVVKDGHFTVRDTDFTAEDDEKYDISAKFKMTEGGKRTAAGTYDCTFKLVSNDTNYEGTAVDSSWYITHKEATGVNAGLTWDNDRSTLYDNGRIHVEITRNADDKIRDDKEVAKIAKFGVLFDKVGKLAAPAAYGVDYKDVADITEAEYKSGKHTNDGSDITAAEREKYLAEQMLEYGNKAFGEGGYTKTTSVTCASQTYKANIEVSDVDTGMWLRPYILYEDGTVSYGDIKYLDLTHEAINHLKLKMADLGDNGAAVRKADLTAAQTKTLEKTMQYVKTGYNVVENKFYAYTSYVDLETAGFTNVAQVADFGVVVDRNAAITAPATTYADMTAEQKATVDKALRIGATKGLVVGHYKKDNPVLKENEYAASIKLGNAATGCWVRPYIDLGGGLVIYADPVYIKSASEYYGAEAAGTLKTVWENDNHQRLIFTQVNAAGNAEQAANDRIAAIVEQYNAARSTQIEAKDVEIVKTGVIADKKNLLNKPTEEKVALNGTKYTELVANAPFNTQMILGAGFIDGKKSSDFGTVYTAKLSPKDTNDVSVRTYTVYNIKGVEVTVYGPVKTFEYSTTVKRVVNNRSFDNTTGLENTSDDVNHNIAVQQAQV